MDVEIHYMNNIHTYAYYIYHKYNFNTYIKIHPYVTIKYIQDAINLVVITTYGTYQLING
jgi:hypothetical protein